MNAHARLPPHYAPTLDVEMLSLGDKLVVYDEHREPIMRTVVEEIEDHGVIRTDDGRRWAPVEGELIKHGRSHKHPTVRHPYHWRRVGTHRKWCCTIGAFSLDVRQIPSGTWVSDFVGSSNREPFADRQLAQHYAEAALARAVQLLGNEVRA